MCICVFLLKLSNFVFLGEALGGEFVKRWVFVNMQTFVCSTIILIGLVCAIAGTYSSVAGIVDEFGS